MTRLTDVKYPWLSNHNLKFEELFSFNSYLEENTTYDKKSENVTKRRRRKYSIFNFHGLDVTKVSTMSGSLAKTFGRLRVFWKAIALVVLPLGLLPLVFNPQETDSGDKLKSKCAYVGLLMAFSWMLELLPLPVTSLIPVALFPLFGVMSTEEVSMEYLNKTCMLFVGGKKFFFLFFFLSFSPL